MNDKYQIIIQTIDIIISHLSQNNSPVLNYIPPEKLKEKLNLSIPKKSKNDDETISFIKQYLDYSAQTHHKNFCNQLFSKPNIYSIIGEILAVFTNSSMYTFENSPVATILEIEILKKMKNIIGFQNGDGIFTTGGSNSNMIALLAARNYIYPESKENGIYIYNNLVAFVSDQSHYSYMKAANIMGIGTNNIIRVQSDTDGKIIPELLETEILNTIQNNKFPFFIGATAATTILGAFDDFSKISYIAKKYNMWMHIDAAYGGSVILSNKHKNLLQGSELADSFSWNPHKLMGVHLPCSAFFTKYPSVIESFADENSKEYLFHEHHNSDYDLGNNSLQCGRRPEVLKLWTSWMHYGDEGYEKQIDHLMELSKYAENFVKNCDLLELCFPVQFLNICFQYIPEDKNTDINDFNENLRQYIAKSGKLLINYAKCKGKKFFRLVINNHELTNSDIENFFNIILNCAEKSDLKEN